MRTPSSPGPQKQIFHWWLYFTDKKKLNSIQLISWSWECNLYCICLSRFTEVASCVNLNFECCSSIMLFVLQFSPKPIQKTSTNISINILNIDWYYVCLVPRLMQSVCKKRYVLSLEAPPDLTDSEVYARWLPLSFCKTFLFIQRCNYHRTYLGRLTSATKRRGRQGVVFLLIVYKINYNRL